MKKILTIDGPSGVGKGTIARILATKLGWNLLDSGAIYRALALLADQKNIAFDDENSLANLASAMDLRFEVVAGQELLSVYLLEQEVSVQLRTQACGEIASKIAKYSQVRASLLQRQRDFATKDGLIADGRDMGSVVFADAPFKVFLTASSLVRAKRRLKQLQSADNASKITGFLHDKIVDKAVGRGFDEKQALNLAQIQQEIQLRDERDSNRKSSPLIPAEDALVIDTSSLTIKEVLFKIEQLF